MWEAARGGCMTMCMSCTLLSLLPWGVVQERRREFKHGGCRGKAPLVPDRSFRNDFFFVFFSFSLFLLLFLFCVGGSQWRRRVRKQGVTGSDASWLLLWVLERVLQFLLLEPTSTNRGMTEFFRNLKGNY